MYLKVNAPPTGHNHRVAPQKRRTPNVFRFPPAKGKLLKEVRFSTAPGHHSIILDFQDNTTLNFAIDLGFAVSAAYSEWENGEETVRRHWPAIRSYSSR